MDANTFWNGVELSSALTKRGERLTAIKDNLSLYHKATVGDKDKRLQELARAIALYAKAKDWKGPGTPVGERDKKGAVKNTITTLIAQVDAHLARSASGNTTIWQRVQATPMAAAAPQGTPHTQEQILAAIEKMDDLRTILVCDIPIGPRLYIVEKTSSSLVDQAKINLAKVDNPAGWITLGRGVLTNQMGKCWSCAAAAIYRFVADPQFDRIRIESAGAAGYDHHFVVLNRTAGDGKISTWNEQAVIVDLWQANLHNWDKRKPGTPTTAQLSYKCKDPDFPYGKGEMTFFCDFRPQDRAQQRADAGHVGKFVQANVANKAWESLSTCMNEHVLKKKKIGKACPCSGWCDKA